jgi:predicted nucleic acid-binding protein
MLMPAPALFSRVEFTDVMQERCINIRRKTGLLLPDAIIAAAAMELHTIVISNDDHLRKLRYPGYASQAIVSQKDFW